MKMSDYLKGLIAGRTPRGRASLRDRRLDQLFTWRSTPEGHNFWLVIAVLLGQLVPGEHSYNVAIGTEYSAFNFQRDRLWPSFIEGEVMMDAIRAALGDKDTIDREACDIIATILKINGY